MGTRCEMKNVNTFSGAVRAIEYEAKRQIEVLETGGEIHQETRRWDDAKGQNFLLRSKEDSHDYRYFPEPDLLTIVIDEEKIQRLKEELPELPNKKLKRSMESYGLPHFDANLLTENPNKAAFFESCVEKENCKTKNISNWLLGDVSRILNEKNLVLADTSLTPEKLTGMIALIEKGTISVTAGKTVLEQIIFSDKTPEQVVEEKGLAQISDTAALSAIVKSILDANPKSIADYKGGKTNVIGFLIGQCMRQSKGQGNPAVLKDLIEKQIQEG